MIDPIYFGRKKLSFNVNVDGLKAGDKVHLLDLTVKSNNSLWDGLNNFCWISRPIPIQIDGIIYGYLAATSEWGQNQNGGDQASPQNPDGSAMSNRTGHNVHELFVVMTKDYHGIGNQHIEIDTGDKNDLSLMNLDVGPQVFGSDQEVNGSIIATDHDGNMVSTKQFKFVRPTIDQLKVRFQEPKGIGFGDGQPHAAIFSSIIVGDDSGNRWQQYTGVTYNIQDNYQFAMHYDRTSDVIAYDDFIPGKTYSGRDGEQVDLGFQLLDDQGYPLQGFRNVTASNVKSFTIPRTNLEDGLSIDQLKAKLRSDVSEVLSSYDPDHRSYNMVANITKNWIQERTKPILTNKDALLRTYPAWWLERLPKDKWDAALNASMNFYKQNQYMAQSFIFWNPDLRPVNPNATDTINGHIWALNAPDEKHTDNYTASQKNPNFLSLISGQAGIHVHYVDSNGKALHQQDNFIDDANKTVPFTVTPIPGYVLDATNAKIPSNVETIEQTGTVVYPKDGQWKDVYIVYKPFISQNGQEIHYHYIKTILLLVIIVVITFYVISTFLSLNYFSSYSY